MHEAHLNHPVVIIGAGPIGLAAAAHLLERGCEAIVLEAGAYAGSAMLEWSHIKLFSTWKYNVDSASRRLLETACEGYAGDWVAPRETKLPTGAEMVSEYLAPLAAHPTLAPRVRYGHRVTSVTRVDAAGASVDKTRTAGREAALFLVRTAGGEEFTARAVIDASGTWGTPNPVGRSGLPAAGEARACADGLVTTPLPDVLGADAARFAGRTVLVVGSGHSAMNTLISLGRLRRQQPSTEVLWGLRGAADPARLYGGGPADQLPARGQLGTSLRRLVEAGDIQVVENMAVTGLEAGERLAVSLADGRELTVDYLVPATGFRPALEMLSELRLELDPAVEAPRALGPLIDPEFHSCGSVEAHGERVLAHPEPNFYIAGMKSYGRAPTFLMATGYEQVRSLAAALAGDRAAADHVELTLPTTGVCSTEVVADAPAGPATAACGGDAVEPANSCSGSASKNL